MNRGEYTNLILDQMLAVLGPAGFVRRGKCFRAERDEAVLLVQLQRDRYSTPDWVGVTVNLGVCLRVLQARGLQGLSGIAHGPCHWYERIGFVTPYDWDQWWEVSDFPAAVEAGAEIASLLRLYCLPLLSELASVQGLRAYWQTGGDAGITERERRAYLAALERA